MSGPTARMGDHVLLRYVLRLENGMTIVSNLEDAEPEALVLGDGTLAAALENLVVGLAAGERRCASLAAGVAFGQPDPALVQDLALKDLPAEPALRSGTLMEFSLPDGGSLAGHVLEVGPEHARVDFNHPLAGYGVEFDVELVRILPSA